MNSAVTQHSGDVFSCMLNIQHALKKHDTYKNNYQGILQLPIVRKLKEQNKRLKQQLRILQESLSEPNVTCSKRSVLQNRKKDNPLQTTEKLSDASTTFTASSLRPTVGWSRLRPSGADPNATVLRTSTLGSNSDVVLLEENNELDDDDDDVVIISDSSTSLPVPVVIKIEKNVEVDHIMEVSKPKNNVIYEVIETEVVEEEEEEEVVEEEEEEEEEEVVEIVEEEVVEEEVVAEEEEEEEYEEVTINGVAYCTCDKENGSIFELTEDGEIGVEKGIYKNGKPSMHA